MVNQDPFERIQNRLNKIAVENLTDDQAIQFAQAQGLLVSARVQVETYNYQQLVIMPRLQQIIYTLECDYRHKYGKFPEKEKWPEERG